MRRLGLALFLLWAAMRAEAAPVVVSDRDFIAAAARQAGADPGRLGEGRVAVAWSGNPRALVLFLDGTEVGRLESARAEALLEGYPGVRAELGAEASAGAGMGAGAEGAAWKGLFAPGALRHLGAWEEQAVLGYHVDYLYSGILVRRNRAEASALKRFGPIYLGVDAGYLSFKGELPDSVPYAGKAGSLGGGVTLGTYFLRYHLQYAPFALPGYFWTEHALKRKYFTRNTAAGGTKVVKIFEVDSPPTLEHEVDARFGWLRYTLTLAPDIYKSPLHTVAFDDLPGVLGVWGAGIIVTPDGLIPGGWYRFAPLSITQVTLGESVHPLRLSLGRITYFRSDKSQFQLAWNGELTFGLKGNGP